MEHVKPTYDDLERYIRQLEESNAMLKRKLQEPGQATVVNSKASNHEMNLTQGVAPTADYYKTLIENSLQGYTILQDKRVVFANKMIANISGYDAYELLSMSWQMMTEIIHPEHRPEILDKLKVLESGQDLTHNLEFRIIRKDGQIRWVETFASVIDYMGSPAVQITYIDITGRKNTELALRESETQKNLILNATSEMIAYYTTDLEIIWVNKAASDSVGKSPEELSGLHCYEVWHQRDEPCENCPVLVAKKEKVPQSAEMQTPDGRYWLIRSFPVFDKDKNVIALSEFGYDITKTRQTESDLACSEERFRKSFDSGLIAMAISKRRDGTYIEANPGFLELTGYSREEVIGHTSGELNFFSNSQREKLIASINKHGHLHNQEMTFPTKSGEMRHILFSIGQITIGNEECLLATMVDHTEQKNIKEEKEISLQLLRELSVPCDLHELIARIIKLIKRWTACEAVGIRLREKEDYPYFESFGFPGDFIISENNLCKVDEQGRFVQDFTGRCVLECMCGRVIQNEIDPDKPYFTKNGSFWSNSISGLLRNDRTKKTVRKGCLFHGFESVALIPIRYGDETLGLLQLNDHRKNKFDKHKVKLFEQLTANLALGLKQRYVTEELKKSEEKYRNIFTSAPLGIFRSTRHGRFAELNMSMAEMLGYTSPEEAMESITNIAEQVYSDSVHRTVILNKVNESNRAEKFETVFKKKNGEVFTVFLILRAIKNILGQVLHYEGIIEDITDRKKQETVIMKKELRYRKLMEESPVGIALFIDGKLEEANKKYHDIAGYPEFKSFALQKITENTSLTPFNLQLPGLNNYRLHKTDDGVRYLAESVSEFIIQGKTYVQSIVQDITSVIEIEEKKKKLASETAYIDRKLNLLKHVEIEVNHIIKKYNYKKEHFSEVLRMFKNEIRMDKHWKIFKDNFESLHSGFFDRLASISGKLTQQDLKHCALMKLNYETKEIAAMFNIQPTSVQMSRVRLKKKLGLKSNEDLIRFILQL